MVKLYLDANVILDYLQKRPNAEFMEKILLRAHKQEIKLITSVLNFATIFYIEKRRRHSTKQILQRFRLINKVITVVDQSSKSYYAAIESGFSDFEDALQYFSAIEANADYFITNNKRHFKKSGIPVFTAREFLSS